VPVVLAPPAVARRDRVHVHHAPGTSVPSRDPARCLRASAARDRDGTVVRLAWCS
jgi:hypothetical protein